MKAGSICAVAGSALLLGLGACAPSEEVEDDVAETELASTDPAVSGTWSAPRRFVPAGAPGVFVAVHMSLLPDGRIVAWSHDGDDSVPAAPPGGYQDHDDSSGTTQNAYVWNPATDAFVRVPNGEYNVFCTGHTFLPDGRLLVPGGHGGYPPSGARLGLRYASTFDYRSMSWTELPKMRAGRWYPTAVPLGTGDVLVASGKDGVGKQNNISEIWQNGTSSWRALTSASISDYQANYPWLFLASSGKVFHAGWTRNTYFLDTSGTGKLTKGPSSTKSKRYAGSAVMYDTDKILIVGGNTDTNRSASDISSSAEVINLHDSSPAWRKVSSMAYKRFHMNATLLADGKVLATGGTGGQDKNGEAAAKAVKTAELWDPKTETWTQMASMQVARMYHSTALLLPDGRVLSAGGGLPLMSGEPKGSDHQDMEIFSPPYLFKGARPTISAAPLSVGYSQTVRVGTPEAMAIAKVHLLRISSVTHTFNMNQRICKLSFSPNGAGLDVKTPTSRNACPRGHYMLFILNGAGVPSVAKIVQLQ